MSEFKLIVAGSRGITDREMIADMLCELVSTIYEDRSVSIVSGMARGPDRIAYDFAKAEDVTCYEFYPDWDKHGKIAGFIRNREMGDFADGLLAFWDGKSSGTKDMIDYMLITKKKPVHLVRVDMGIYIKSFN
jgi:hypothetical protein